MSARRALVVHTRMPAFDRDSGSQDIDNIVQFLLRAGWRVTFLAREEEGVAEERHAERLRQMGVETHAGFASAERLLRSNDFDVAIIAFWELARALLPKLRELAPATRVVINSMDVHFLRAARQHFGRGEALGDTFGDGTAHELNTYNAADAVIAVSEKERELLADFVGEDRVFHLPVAESIARSPYPLERRRGMYFVGNFRHLPNREAVEFMCREVLPLLDRRLLEHHPFTVIGNWLENAKLDIDPLTPGLKLVGWVPSVQPYIEQSRIGVVPLLHGAGVKRKVIQSVMAGTPVVTTHVGAEGLELGQGLHALIAADTDDFAAGVSRLLTEDDVWRHISDAGARHVESRHGFEVVERRFVEIIDRVMTKPSRARSRHGGERAVADIDDRLQTLVRPGEIVLVAGVAVDPASPHEWWPFPQDRDGNAGYEPATGDAAINHLEAQRLRGARYFVLPRTAFAWRHRYPEFAEHLDHEYTRVHGDAHVIVYDLAARADSGPLLESTPPARVHVVGTYAANRTGPPASLRNELASSPGLEITQQWHASGDGPPPEIASAGADFIVHVRDDAVLPTRFLDRLVATQTTLGVDRVQPTHNAGPTGGAPVTERHLGTVAREIDDVTDLPVLSVRAGAEPRGPVTLADNVTVGLRHPISTASGNDAFVRRVWLAEPGQRPVCFRRDEPHQVPRISVLIATYERPQLLHACLSAFAEQTVPRDSFEVVVVDDGSRRHDLTSVLEQFSSQLQITGIRIEHGGRSAAKNHAVFLARAPILLFFDDDDRPAPDYLERHLAAHEQHPAETVAVLGHTDWAPELERTPLMHYITDVDRLMFAYDRLGHGQLLDWRGFWEGRISCKRSLLVRHGLHDQRLPYSIDIEMGWRLAPTGLRVVYDSSALSFMARPLDFETFCERTEAKGRAHAVIAALHRGTAIAERLNVADAARLWQERGDREPALRARVANLEARVQTDPRVLDELHGAYREVFRLLHAKGAAQVSGPKSPPPDNKPPQNTPPKATRPFALEDPPLMYDGTPPEWDGEAMLSITIPVWSRTPELAEMARRTIERVWEVARLPTEIVVIDNGSPYDMTFPAKVYRYPENRGVSTGWNTGIRLARAPVVVVLNSDCRVEPGWDEALYEAVCDGRRIAFPYTDHCDGLGFVQPDQAGTAGWCFMLTKELYNELGPFDEWFSPAFCEDTDYWHRAWESGVELSPVPAARVVHARRTSSQDRSDLLLQAHRFKYGWKHNVDPLRAPPYYKRDIVEYLGTGRPVVVGHDKDPERPRIFGIGLNKTGTTSLNQALSMLGYESLHWGGPPIRRIIEVSLAAGEPLLSRIDPRFDAFSDILRLSENYRILDEQYPGSRFILTVRPVEEWIESRRRHVESNRRRRAAGEYTGKFLTVDEEAWHQEWKQHVEQARTYFEGRSDFLELDVTAAPEWEPLCRFLGVPVPEQPFPWANRSGAEPVR